MSRCKLSSLYALYTLSEHCRYEALIDEMVCDRIVVGIQDRKLSEKLQLDATLTLEKAITSVHQAEAVKKQQSVVSGDRKDEEVLHTDCPVQVVHDTPQPSRQQPIPRQRASASPCQWCGRSSAHKWQKCPTQSVTCYWCSKWGNFQSVCRATPHTNPIYLEPPKDTETGTFLGGVTSRDSPNPWTVNGAPTNLLIDTGGKVTVISEHTHNSIGSPSLLPPARSLKVPSNHPLPVKSYFSGSLKFGSLETQQDICTCKLANRPTFHATVLQKRYLSRCPAQKHFVPHL